MEEVDSRARHSRMQGVWSFGHLAAGTGVVMLTFPAGETGEPLFSWFLVGNEAYRLGFTTSLPV
jgi:hypothetical protein